MVLEATGDYWKPFYYLLEEAPFELILANPTQVPGAFRGFYDLITTISGVSDLVAQVVIAEIGTTVRDDFPSPGHLASWAGTVPGSNSSAMAGTGEVYTDLGADHHRKRNPERSKRNAINQLEALGFDVSLTRSPPPANPQTTPAGWSAAPHAQTPSITIYLRVRNEVATRRVETRWRTRLR